jgi:hypothetical protein
MWGVCEGQHSDKNVLNESPTLNYPEKSAFLSFLEKKIRNQKLWPLRAVAHTHGCPFGSSRELLSRLVTSLITALLACLVVAYSRHILGAVLRFELRALHLLGRHFAT